MAGKQKQKIAKKILSILMLGLFVFGSAQAFAQEGDDGSGDTTLYDPVGKQIIQLTDEGTQEDWNISRLETYGLKFLVRGKDALTWSLNIEDAGFHNPAIEKSYIKVLTIVNSFFILGLLAIAIMWMFSILIPRKYLKKVILIYSLAVVFINFALPINQLFIDGTNLLQKTLLTEDDGSIQITDIVQTPAYEDALSFESRSAASLVEGKQTENVTLKLEGADEETTSIGKIRVPQGEDINDEVVSLNNKEISIIKDSPFSPYQEQVFFRFGLLLITGIAYFIIALIFVLRIVILWALLILSPILLLLAIFRSTRGWFFNWLGMYGRWLLIGPLTALGIAVIVNIWQLSGLPISVSNTYTPELFSAEKVSNIVFYLPGKDTANTLSNTQEMMEYIIFLIMLYLPIIMAFNLTRQKYLQGGLVVVKEGISKAVESAQTKLHQQSFTYEKEEEKRERPGGLLGNFRYMINDKISDIATAALPIEKLKVEPETPTRMMPTASNFLPESLKETPVPKMLELLGMQKDSKASHKSVIEKLARVEKTENNKEKEKIMAIMNEIESRAGDKDKEALSILHEVETVKEMDMRNEGNMPVAEVRMQNEGSGDNGSGSAINISVNDSRPESDRKVRDASFDSKSEEKGKKSKDKKNKKEEKKKEEDKKPENKSDEKMNANPEENAN